jgi:hypothetical protein
MSLVASALWRRLDTAGHDACALERLAKGWRLCGTALFSLDGAPVCLRYRVECDKGWATLRGEIHGFAGTAPVDHAILRTETGWLLDGVAQPGLQDLCDLDFGFTPATNLLQLRRTAPEPGQKVEFSVAWFDLGQDALTRLPQRYERRTEKTYWYESPSVGYEALLEIGPTGFAQLYPELWRAESAS